MIFNSYIFLFGFLPLLVGVFYLLQKRGLSTLHSALILVFSLVFYATWGLLHLILLLISISINYGIFLLMKSYQEKIKFFMTLGVLFNIGLILYFKYWNFLICDVLHIKAATSSLSAIPIGISFYTFTQISFLVDSYKNRSFESDFVNYALFVSYFPHLICGPIMNFKSVYPQLKNKTKFHLSVDNTVYFLIFFSMGLFKKCAIADSIAEIGGIYKTSGIGYLFFDSIQDTLLYAFQLYFDFSGYSDMAVGLSYLFGIEIPINFAMPYKATSIIDFWRRWHISLSSFLRDYVYIPLGGKYQRYRNVFLTMTIGGLWHGASYNFLLWGMYHGVLLAINHFLVRIRKPGDNPLFIVRGLKMLCTFSLVCLGWVLFASKDISHACEIYKGIFGMNGMGAVQRTKIGWVIVSVLFCFMIGETKDFALKHAKTNKNDPILVLSFLCVIGVLFIGRVSPFLYEGF